MNSVSPVLPHYPSIPEVKFGGPNAGQPQFFPLPVAIFQYNNGVDSRITRWRFSWRERIKILFSGCVWLEMLTHDVVPQRITVNEPLTKADQQ